MDGDEIAAIDRRGAEPLASGEMNQPIIHTVIRPPPEEPAQRASRRMGGKAGASSFELRTSSADLG